MSLFSLLPSLGSGLRGSLLHTEARASCLPHSTSPQLWPVFSFPRILVISSHFQWLHFAHRLRPICILSFLPRRFIGKRQAFSTPCRAMVSRLIFRHLELSQLRVLIHPLLVTCCPLPSLLVCLYFLAISSSVKLSPHLPRHRRVSQNLLQNPNIASPGYHFSVVKGRLYDWMWQTAMGIPVPLTANMMVFNKCVLNHKNQMDTLVFTDGDVSNINSPVRINFFFSYPSRIFRQCLSFITYYFPTWLRTFKKFWNTLSI